MEIMESPFGPVELPAAGPAQTPPRLGNGPAEPRARPDRPGAGRPAPSTAGRNVRQPGTVVCIVPGMVSTPEKYKARRRGAQGRTSAGKDRSWGVLVCRPT